MVIGKHRTKYFFRHATPYHAPVFLAQKKGYFADEGIKVALLEPNDPSGKSYYQFPKMQPIINAIIPDVTEIIGSEKVDLGFKAMIHTLAGKARGFPILSIGSLLDEPFTGVVYLKDSGITTDFKSLYGKRIGYVGEFGKVFDPLNLLSPLRLLMISFLDPNRRTHEVLWDDA